MKEIHLRLKDENIKTLSIENIQSMILWMLSRLPAGKTKSPSFFAIKNRDSITSINIVKLKKPIEREGIKVRDYNLMPKKSFFKYLVTEMDRSSIVADRIGLTLENVKPFLLDDTDLIYSTYNFTIPTSSMLLKVDHSTFWRATGPSKHFLVAMDCEMLKTTEGSEIGRISLIDHCGNVIFDRYVMPNNDIIDFMTEYSGLTDTNIKHAPRMSEVKRDLYNIIGINTTILGHGLENDLISLQIYHELVIDTSHIFVTRDKRRIKLRDLVKDYFGRKIQIGTHSSVVDARACLELLKWKLIERKMLIDSAKDKKFISEINWLAEIDEKYLCGKQINIVKRIEYKMMKDVLKRNPNSVFLYFWSENNEMYFNFKY